MAAARAGVGVGTGAGAAWRRLQYLKQAHAPRAQAQVQGLSSEARAAPTAAPTAEAGVGAQFPGAPDAAYCSQLRLAAPGAPLPVYRAMDEAGAVLDPQAERHLDRDTALHVYRTMLLLHTMDNVLYESQRQGRISFYMTSGGEEALTAASGAGTLAADVVYAQYREAGALLARGVPVQQLLDQCTGNRRDAARGRQMPVHYGSRHHNVATISSPLGTQLPQAAGAAYALKLRAQRQRGASGDTSEEGDTSEGGDISEGGESCVFCYLGEGAASEGDAHAALNFAATLRCPVVYICRNNGWAISTSAREQYGGDGVAARALALGVRAARVDGTDALAVLHATRTARRHALLARAPVLIEAMAYRAGHHSTSDDSSAYRPGAELEPWRRQRSPLAKMQRYLLAKGWWDSEAESACVSGARAQVLGALAAAEREPRAPPADMLHDVYADMPPHLRAQAGQLRRHLAQHGQHYPLHKYERDE